MSDGVFWSEFERWLLAHGIDPANTAQIAWTPNSTRGCGPIDGPDSLPGGPPIFLEVTTFKLRDGQRYLENGEVATETRLVPMQYLPAVEVARYRGKSGPQSGI